MKKNQVLIGSVFVLLACVLSSLIFSSCTANRRAPRAQANFDGNVEERPASNRDRDSGRECDRSDDCADWCEELFNASKDEDACLELDEDIVEEMWDAFGDGSDSDELLVDPDLDKDLGKVTARAIEEAQKIKDDIWIKLIKKYSKPEAEDVLEWMADNSSIFTAVQNSLDDDEEEDFLEELLKRFNSSIPQALSKEIGDDPEPEDTFMALASKQEKLIELSYEVLIQNCSKSIYSTAGSEDGYQEAACTLGEVFCKQEDNDYIFEDVFDEVVDAASSDFKSYITDEGRASGPGADGLDVDSDDASDVEEVCPVFCRYFRTAPAC